MFGRAVKSNFKSNSEFRIMNSELKDFKSNFKSSSECRVQNVEF
jgi:hypothetical protein